MVKRKLLSNYKPPEKKKKKVKEKIKKEPKRKLLSDRKLTKKVSETEPEKKTSYWKDKRKFQINDLGRTSPLGNKLYSTSHYDSIIFEVDRESGRRLFQRPSGINDIRYLEKDKDFFNTDINTLFQEVADEVMSIDRKLIREIFFLLCNKIAKRIKAGFSFLFPGIGTLVCYHQPERKYLLNKRVYNVFDRKFLFFVKSASLCIFESHYIRDNKMKKALERGAIRDDSRVRGDAWYLRSEEDQYTPVQEYMDKHGLGTYDEEFSYEDEGVRDMARKCKKEYKRRCRRR